MKTYSRLTLTFLLLILVVPQAGADEPPKDRKEVKVWNDSSGKYKIEAAFVELVDGKVVVLKRASDGKKIKVPLDKLDEESKSQAKRLQLLPPMNGRHIVYYANGEKKAAGSYKNGKKDGLWTRWLDWEQWEQEALDSLNKEESFLDDLDDDFSGDDGGVQKTHFNNGKKDGLESGWYENGQKQFEAYYENGKLISASVWKSDGTPCPETNVANGSGIFVYWFGRKTYEIQFKDSERVRETAFYENGQKQSEEHYKNGKGHGISTESEWYENGQLESRSQYKNGKEEGLATEWYDNGKKYSEIQFKEGERDGRSTQWYANGQKHWEQHYKDDNLVSASVWKPNGEPCPITTIAEGSGILVIYYENGQKQSEEHYKNSKLDGLWTAWHENGKKFSEGHYKNGKIDGLHTDWRENGQKESEIQYKNGKEVSRKEF